MTEDEKCAAPGCDAAVFPSEGDLMPLGLISFQLTAAFVVPDGPQLRSYYACSIAHAKQVLDSMTVRLPL